jgi:hypothetical protein
VEVDAIRHARAIVFSCGALRSADSAAAVTAARQLTQGLVCCDPGCFPRAWGSPTEIEPRI